MAPSAPPTPKHTLRSHSAPVNALFISHDNERIYSGDANGLVVITSTRTIRTLTSWQAHTDSLLGIQEWGQNIITHARDNKLHVWTYANEPTITVGSSAALPAQQMPNLSYSMDVNALNYCRFSLMPIPFNNTEGSEALIALPNLVESSQADIWSLPSQKRLHAAIGKTHAAPGFLDGRGKDATGIVMSMHLFAVPANTQSASSSRMATDELRLLCAYEHGGVKLWRYTRTDKSVSIEGIGWDIVWSAKLHIESVMAMTVTCNNNLALDVSADNLIGRYDVTLAETNVTTGCVAHRTKHPGNGAITVRDDGRVCAVGGWDGKIRLYSTRTLKPLGTLEYHKTGCQAVAFAHPITDSGTQAHGGDSDEEDFSMVEKEARTRWLVAGGKDGRVSIWALMDFEKSK